MSIDDDNESTRAPQLQEVMERAARAVIAEWVHSGCPARVERYDDSKQLVDVKPLVKDFHRSETGALVVASVPILTSLQVGFYSASGFQITTPIEVGTIGWVHFADRSLDRWLAGNGQEVDPEIYTRFNLTDGRFVPGGLTFGAPLASAPTDKMVVGQAAGGRIEITNAGGINVTGASGQPITITAGAGANVSIDAGAAANVVVNGGVGQMDVARATVDLAGGYPIVSGAPSRFKAGVL
jgi:hypothetical protein